MPIFFVNLIMAKAAKKKATPKKEAKPRAEEYEPKLAIKGSFADVIGVVMKPKEEKKSS